MNMRLRGRGILLGTVIALLVSTPACSKKSTMEQAVEAAKSVAESTAGTAPATPAQNDYTQAYLTDEKMAKFIDSLKEELNPFALVFKGKTATSLTDLGQRMKEYNAFAQKYGFADYADYMAVWGRITVGQMEMAGAQFKKSTIEMMEKQIKTAEAELAKPDLSPEMKSIYDEQIKSAKESIGDLQKPESTGSQLNASDLALIEKYKAQIEEATKKYQQK